MHDFDPLLREAGYAFVTAADMRGALEACGSIGDFDRFAESWNDLGPDQYRTTGDRRRRYAVYRVDASDAVVRQPHQPHLQQPQYNALFGGVERWFDPVIDAVSESDTLTTILRCFHCTVRRLAPDTRSWHVEVHQFRIEARADAPGEPTPEGVHRDGVDFVLVLLVRRENIASGTTTVYDLGGRALGSFTLSRPFDAALVDDHRVAHGVTPVAPLDPSLPAYRDVLVVTFRARA